MNDDPTTRAPKPAFPASCLVVRVGHGANCSSIGSVVDTLFVGATLGGTVLAAVCAAMKNESVTVVGRGAAERVTRAAADDDDDLHDPGERS